MSDTEDVRNALLSTVRSKVSQLQRLVLEDKPGAVATLARLRRCDPAEVGADPSVWEVTLSGLPDELTHRRGVRRDEPTPAERALHGALVLYALHQQSRDAGVHVKDMSFGTAVGRLARARAVGEELDGGVVGRLHQAALSNDFAGQLHHLRGLIQLMRTERPPVGLDYGLLAVDLWQLDDPQQDSRRVLTRWGRDLHTRSKTTEPTETEETK